MDCPCCEDGQLNYVGIFKTFEHRDILGDVISGDASDAQSEDMDSYLVCDNCETKFDYDTRIGFDKQEHIVELTKREDE